MPNARYSKGKRFERHVAAIYERMGWFSHVSGGSHGVDVVAISPAHCFWFNDTTKSLNRFDLPQFHFTHCRNWQRGGRLSPEEREAAIEQAHKFGATPMLAYKGKGKLKGWTICKEIV